MRQRTGSCVNLRLHALPTNWLLSVPNVFPLDVLVVMYTTGYFSSNETSAILYKSSITSALNIAELYLDASDIHALVRFQIFWGGIRATISTTY